MTFDSVDVSSVGSDTRWFHSQLGTSTCIYKNMSLNSSATYGWWLVGAPKLYFYNCDFTSAWGLTANITGAGGIYVYTYYTPTIDDGTNAVQSADVHIYNVTDSSDIYKTSGYSGADAQTNASGQISDSGNAFVEIPTCKSVKEGFIPYAIYISAKKAGHIEKATQYLNIQQTDSTQTISISFTTAYSAGDLVYGTPAYSAGDVAWGTPAYPS